MLDLFSPSFFSYRYSNNEQLILGRYDEDVILPCLFTSGSQVVIHWISQDNYVHSYYSGKDQLKKQYSSYANRTSLFHSEINNGNASLTVRRLHLQDEGIYICYVGTTSTRTENTVVLKVGAFHRPLIKYEQRDTERFLVCSISSVYPYPHITWKMDNTNVPESSSQVTGAPGPFNINSTLNIRGSNSSFECTIENSLLNQKWRGEWTLAGSHWKNEGDSISLWCTTSFNFSLLNQDFNVSWYKVVNGASSVLKWHLNSSQDTTTNDPQFSGNKELRYHSDFSLILKDLRASDSGEYLCNVSSTEYTLLIVHRLQVGKLQKGHTNGFWVLQQRFVKTFQYVIDGNIFAHGGR
ncbi:HERV-H LTR-associating protein 2 [Lemmus lemmus]